MTILWLHPFFMLLGHHVGMYEAKEPEPQIKQTKMLTIGMQKLQKNFYPIVPAVNKNPDEKFAPRTLHPFFMLS